MAMERKVCDEFGNVDYIYDVVDIGWKYDISQIMLHTGRIL